MTNQIRSNEFKKNNKLIRSYSNPIGLDLLTPVVEILNESCLYMLHRDLHCASVDHPIYPSRDKLCS
jgi:hypothetical protein